MRTDKYKVWIMLIGVLFLFQIVFTNLIKQYIYNENNFQIDKRTLIAGASHGSLGIDPQYIESSLNICREGEKLEFTYLKLRYLLEINPDISNILLTISPSSVVGFDDIYNLNTLLDFINFLNNYDDGLDIIKKNQTNYFVSTLKWNWGIIPLTKQEITVLLKKITGMFNIHDFNSMGGFKTKERIINKDDILNYTVNLRFYQNDELKPISQNAMKALDKIAILCREHDIELTLISAPTRTEYTERIPEVFEINFRDTVAKYSSFDNISYVDYTNYFQDNRYFFDYDHLNKNGAELFSEEINNHINN